MLQLDVQVGEKKSGAVNVPRASQEKVKLQGKFSESFKILIELCTYITR